MFALETRGKTIAWVKLAEQRSRDAAIAHCDMLATELGRYVRVIRYRPEFEIVYSNTPTPDEAR